MTHAEGQPPSAREPERRVFPGTICYDDKLRGQRGHLEEGERLANLIATSSHVHEKPRRAVGRRDGA